MSKEDIDNYQQDLRRYRALRKQLQARACPGCWQRAAPRR
jgi:hypothetical protein